MTVKVIVLTGHEFVEVEKHTNSCMRSEVDILRPHSETIYTLVGDDHIAYIGELKEE